MITKKYKIQTLKCKIYKKIQVEKKTIYKTNPQSTAIKYTKTIQKVPPNKYVYISKFELSLSYIHNKKKETRSFYCFFD